jgi:hypothetical protein
VPNLAPSRERGVEAAADSRERQSDRGAERAVSQEKQRRERADKAADDELAVAAEVHHAASQRDGGGKSHSHQWRRPIERVRQGSRRQRASDDLGISAERIVAGDQDERGSDQCSETDCERHRRNAQAVAA